MQDKKIRTKEEFVAFISKFPSNSLSVGNLNQIFEMVAIPRKQLSENIPQLNKQYQNEKYEENFN